MALAAVRLPIDQGDHRVAERLAVVPGRSGPQQRREGGGVEPGRERPVAALDAGGVAVEACEGAHVGVEQPGVAAHLVGADRPPDLVPRVAVEGDEAGAKVDGRRVDAVALPRDRLRRQRLPGTEEALGGDDRRAFPVSVESHFPQFGADPAGFAQGFRARRRHDDLPRLLDDDESGLEAPHGGDPVHRDGLRRYLDDGVGRRPGPPGEVRGAGPRGQYEQVGPHRIRGFRFPRRVLGERRVRLGVVERHEGLPQPAGQGRQREVGGADHDAPRVAAVEEVELLVAGRPAQDGEAQAAVADPAQQALPALPQGRAEEAFDRCLLVSDGIDETVAARRGRRLQRLELPGEHALGAEQHLHVLEQVGDRQQSRDARGVGDGLQPPEALEQAAPVGPPPGDEPRLEDVQRDRVVADLACGSPGAGCEEVVHGSRSRHGARAREPTAVPACHAKRRGGIGCYQSPSLGLLTASTGSTAWSHGSRATTCCTIPGSGKAPAKARMRPCRRRGQRSPNEGRPRFPRRLHSPPGEGRPDAPPRRPW